MLNVPEELFEQLADFGQNMIREIMLGRKYRNALRACMDRLESGKADTPENSHDVDRYWKLWVAANTKVADQCDQLFPILSNCTDD